MDAKRLGLLILIIVFVVGTFSSLILADGDGNGNGGGNGGSSGGGSSGGDGGGSSSGSGSSSGGDSGNGGDGSGSSSGNGKSSGGDGDGNGNRDSDQGKSKSNGKVRSNIGGQAASAGEKDGKKNGESKTETVTKEGTRTITKIEEGETKIETITTEGIVTKTKIEEGETKTEVRFPDGTTIKSKVEEGETKVEVSRAGVKVTFKREGNEFKIKVKNEQGEETLVDHNEFLIIDQSAEKEQIRVRTLQDRAIIELPNTQAITDLPISVDLATNVLSVTTPVGERELTVLPDQAIQNMLAANVVDRIGGIELANQVRQGQVAALDQVITLGEANGVPIYEIQGLNENLLLGFIPVTTKATVIVSAETGEVVSTTQSLIATIVEVLSPASPVQTSPTVPTIEPQPPVVSIPTSPTPEPGIAG